MPEAQVRAAAQMASDFIGERRVLRQLLEAALFEKIIDYIYVASTDRVGCFYFNLGSRAMVCQGRRRAFDRVYLHIDTLATTRAGKKQWLAPAAYPELLQQIAWTICEDEINTQKLMRELEQSVYWLNWNANNLAPRQRRELGYAKLETALHEGHPYHPCPKARSGFSVRDHIRYSSECAQAFRIRWLALPKRKLCHKFDIDEHNFYRRELGDRQFTELCRRLQAHGYSPDDFSLVPAHPWQWQHFLQSTFEQEISEGQLIDLGEGWDDYLASQSQRTLINISRRHAADIKLPLNIICTSSTRFLPTHSICTAPYVSEWLQQIVANDAFFQRYPMLILAEFAGMHLAEDQGFPVKKEESQLGAIWRQSIEQYLQEGEQAIPMSALFATEDNGEAFIETWIAGWGVDAWLQQLFRVTVLPVWHLLVAHGIALEVHAQNTLLIVRDGWPIKLAVRDFHESLEYVEGFIHDKKRLPAFAKINPIYQDAPANRYFWMDSVEALRELYMDTLYIFHFSELAKLCEDQWRFPEGAFWHLLAAQLEEYRLQHPQLESRMQALQHNREYIQVESLLRKKISRDESREYHHCVRNPFFKATRQ